jgi:hypothetical protein
MLGIYGLHEIEEGLHMVCVLLIPDAVTSSPKLLKVHQSN